MAQERRALPSALRRARAIGSASALRPWRAGELAPGSDVTGDEELREYVKLATGTFFHLVGTCPIGTNEGAVVDPDLRVRGIGALRVADASVSWAIYASTPPSGRGTVSSVSASVPQSSDEAVYRRFLNPHGRLTASELRYLTEVDHRDHEALLAVDPGSSKRGRRPLRPGSRTT